MKSIYELLKMRGTEKMQSLGFIRILFFCLILFFMTTFMVSSAAGATLSNVLLGLGLGTFIAIMFFSIDIAIKRAHIRTFTTTAFGLLIGCLFAKALLVTFNTLMNATSMGVALQPQTQDILKISLFLLGAFLGTTVTLRFSEELHLSIPFVKLTGSNEKPRKLILDLSILEDPRLIDLASSGIIDEALLVPRFLCKELSIRLESSEEMTKSKARKCLDCLKKLESIPRLKIRYIENDFPEIFDINSKILTLGHSLKGNILSSELTRLDTTTETVVQIVNLNSLANILKPLMQTGEQLKIKVQRHGKEPRQGVGYLEDGTMVVINGGGDFIGETIDAHVLSIKHTSSGRMIFCNAKDEEINSREYIEDRY